jgi:hypothetical protein
VGERVSAAPTGAPILVALLTCAALAAALLAQWSPAFSSYDSDLWTYVLVAERVADGQDMLRAEPFHLEPPAGPHASAAWLALGHLRRWSGCSPLSLARGLALASVALLCAGAVALSGGLFGKGPARALAFLLFWLSLPESWSAVVLGRYLSLGFVALAAAAALDLGKSRGAAVRAGFFIALAFYAHLFGGVVAVGAVLVVSVARYRCHDAPGLVQPALAAGIGALVAMPCLWFALGTVGLARTSAHTWRPEQVEALGFMWMRPGQVLDLLPLGILALSLVGLVAPCRPERRLARTVGRVGTLLVLLVLFTPLYQASVGLFGAWMVGRVAVLAFSWSSATLAIEWIRGEGRSPSRRVAEAVLLLAIGAEATTRAARDWKGEAYPFNPAAREEATGLRATLRDRTFIAPDLLGYGLAAPTLGRPLAVPPGHASPFGDFRRQQRRVHRAFSANTDECWRVLLALYPDVTFLVTPAPGAAIERRIWEERFPGVGPEAVRERLRALGVLTSSHSGALFVVDGLQPDRAPLPPSGRTAGMGTGPRCREEP